jgi:CDP-paratose 2-epimerase
MPPSNRLAVRPAARRATPKERDWVLITGGAGFIGTNLAQRMLEAGRRVLIYDNLSRDGVEENLAWLIQRYGKGVEVEVADVLDQEALRAAVARAGYVFHFAAQVAVTTSLDDPRHDFEVNAVGTLNVLEACRERSDPPALLYTSTNKVYGGLEDLRLILKDSRYQPAEARIQAYGIDETRSLDFHSPYGCSKGTADQYVRDYARCYGLPTVVFRMSCIYGPHQHGTEDQGWVAHFARALLREEPITVYGDGCQVRDLLFVEDLTRAMQMAVAQIEKTRGRAFNIGGGPSNATSVQEVIDLLGELRAGLPRIHSGPWRQGDQKYYVADPRRLEHAIGWRPTTGVPAGLARLMDWLDQEEQSRIATSRLKSAAAGQR